MMHAEMELMENINANEHNVAALNARIKQFKELIAHQRARYKALKQKLEDDTNELKCLEEKQTVIEAKHQQFRDFVTQREGEVQVLRAQFQHQRAAMLSLRCQILHATINLEKLTSQDECVAKETNNVVIAINESIEPTDQRASLQKLRAKIRYTEQFIAQMEKKTSQLVEKGANLKIEVLKYEQEAHKLRELIFFKGKETDVLFNRTREDTIRVKKENGKIERKLKAKRRKFRLKTKNEIRSLKRRISFVTTEIERSQMANEDTMSKIDALSSERENLEERLNARNEQLANTENVIANVSTTLSTFGQEKIDFDTASLQKELTTKREVAEAAQKKLVEKQNLHKLLQADQTQLDATLEDTGGQIVAAKDTAKRLDGEIASLTKDIKGQEVMSKNLGESISNAKKKTDDLQSDYQEQLRNNKIMVKTQATLRRQKDLLFKQNQEMTSELRDAENLSRTLREGIKHGAELARQLSESNTDKRERSEFELRNKELFLKEQCAREESKFQAEIAAWDEKVFMLIV
ncbi:hypothetical protein PHMEG_0002071 [Phytophthora megakarya]|uniref:Uncharacterized protein n=1 Tax=Phytophthora megakarya TaxID=4795 RepID=A0A225WZ33_9STRA|nr:hypothetical protein PHMEG_0002071 [Phytophthora megakarya]